MKIIDAKFGFSPETVTDPIIIHSGNKIAFMFTMSLDNTNNYVDGSVLFKSSTLLLMKSGHPNDEAYSGHDYIHNAVLEPPKLYYSIVEVLDSPWLQEVMKVNMRNFSASQSSFPKARHHIFPFKETTLEVLWDDFSYETIDKSSEDLARELVAWANLY
jgi:hypothetical protein